MCFQLKRSVVCFKYQAECFNDLARCFFAWSDVLSKIIRTAVHRQKLKTKGNMLTALNRDFNAYLPYFMGH